tara:strand:- start:41 stop:190 length:150 start_codon:yes stop_codon:yes gene_type:complete
MSKKTAKYIVLKSFNVKQFGSPYKEGEVVDLIEGETTDMMCNLKLIKKK